MSGPLRLPEFCRMVNVDASLKEQMSNFARVAGSKTVICLESLQQFSRTVKLPAGLHSKNSEDLKYSLKTLCLNFMVRTQVTF